MDDTRAFRDELHVLVSEGADVTIPLDAVGTGNCLVAPDIKDNALDFRHQFVGRPFQRELVGGRGVGGSALSLCGWVACLL
jgi:hypothetical protein